MKEVTQTIAISGMNARPDNPGPGMAVARCLQEAPTFKGRVIGLGYDALDPGLHLSEICDQAYLLPYPSSSSGEFMSTLENILVQEKVDYLLPCLDVELFAIVRSVANLKDAGVSTFLPGQEQLRLCNKDNLEKLADMSGLKTPRTAKLTSPDFFRTCEKNQWHYPLVVKGLFYDAYIVPSAVEAREAFHKISASWGFPVLVQELIQGDELNLTALGDGEGNILAPVMMKKLATTDKGKAWAGVSIHDANLLLASTKIIQHSNWRGPLEVEIIRNKRGQHYLIEINPRFPAWIYLSVGTGGNLPLNLLELACGLEPTPPEHYQAGSMYLRYATETIAPIGNLESLMVSSALSNKGK